MATHATAVPVYAVYYSSDVPGAEQPRQHADSTARRLAVPLAVSGTASNPLPSPPPEVDQKATHDDATVGDFAAHLAFHLWYETPMHQLVEMSHEAEDSSVVLPGSFAELQNACRRAFPITKMGLVELGIAVVLLQRLRRLGKSVQALALHTLFFTVLMLTNKTLSDSPYNARSWSKLTGIPVLELVNWERKVLQWIDWHCLQKAAVKVHQHHGNERGGWVEPTWLNSMFADFERSSRQAKERRRRRKAEREEEQRRQQWAARAYPPSPPQHVLVQLASPSGPPTILTGKARSIATAVPQQFVAAAATSPINARAFPNLPARNLAATWSSSCSSGATTPTQPLSPMGGPYTLVASSSASSPYTAVATPTFSIVGDSFGTPSPAHTYYQVLPQTPGAAAASGELLSPSSTEVGWWATPVMPALFDNSYVPQYAAVVVPQQAVLVQPPAVWRTS